MQRNFSPDISFNRYRGKGIRNGRILTNEKTKGKILFDRKISLSRIFSFSLRIWEVERRRSSLTHITIEKKTPTVPSNDAANFEPKEAAHFFSVTSAGARCSKLS